MSQAFLCSRCHKKEGLFKCGLCHDTPPLCEDCRVPHYKLMHNYDAKSERMAILSTPSKLSKRGKLSKKVDQEAIRKFIREKLQ